MRFSGIDIAARGITARGARGCAFAGVSLEVAAGALGVIVGPQGSGRTSLLLALSGRMRLVAGVASVGGYRLPEQARAVRRLVAVARAEPAAGLDDELRVRDLVAERTLIGPADRAAIAEAFTLLGIEAASDSTVAQLPPEQQALLAVALAAAEAPAAVVVDDIGRGCGAEQTRGVWDSLATLAAHGCTVLAASTDVPALADPVTVVELPHPAQRDQIPLPQE